VSIHLPVHGSLVSIFGEAGVSSLRALVDTVIPPDDYPGGWDSGVGDYLERGFAVQLAPHIPLYLACITSLSEEAQLRYSRCFADLELFERTELLERLQADGGTAEWVISPARFIRIAAEHAAEGFYADPGNGGNRDGISWKMIGFEVVG